MADNAANPQRGVRGLAHDGLTRQRHAHSAKRSDNNGIRVALLVAETYVDGMHEQTPTL
jgi:hypothetical protein